MSNRSDVVPCDVLVIGAGPAGSTAACMLKKYNASLDVLVVDKAEFPREHVGESQLPGTSRVLDEIGAWDRVEAQGFPVKFGGTYTWGIDDEPWDFDFYPADKLEPCARPGRFEGVREHTAFHVERSRYDKILADRARELGARVHFSSLVTRVERTGDRVDAVHLDDGKEIRPRYVVDASGHRAFLRGAMDVRIERPRELRNLAVYGYWKGVPWAERVHEHFTRVQIRSVPFGWLWYIPLGGDMTSIGLVTPAASLKEVHSDPEVLYQMAIEAEPLLSKLCRVGRREGTLRHVGNWSCLSERLCGENWFMVGECAGFADPILTAGMQLAHLAARDAAYTILELERADLEPGWLRDRFNAQNRTNIRQHIRFAEYWYAANGRFTDLQEHCRTIAEESGFNLSPAEAWRWLAQGGFAHDNPGDAQIGSFSTGSMKDILDRFAGDPDRNRIDPEQRYALSLPKLEQSTTGYLSEGRIERVATLTDDLGVSVPLIGPAAIVLQEMQAPRTLVELKSRVVSGLTSAGMTAEQLSHSLTHYEQMFESLIDYGWIRPVEA